MRRARAGATRGPGRARARGRGPSSVVSSPVTGQAVRLRLAPEADESPEVLGEALDLVRREEGFDLLPYGVLGRVGPEELERHLVEVRQVLGAELPEARDVQALLRHPRVGLKPLAVRQLLAADGVE